MDIYKSRGIIFTVDEFLNKLINAKNKKAIVDVCIACHKQLVREADDPLLHRVGVCGADLADSFANLSNLKKTMKLSEIREIIASVVELDGSERRVTSTLLSRRSSMVSNQGYAVRDVKNYEEVEGLFDNLLDASGHRDMPYISDITGWRMFQFSSTRDVACVVLNSDNCFDRRLSDQGEAVKKVFGSCDETEWTQIDR